MRRFLSLVLVIVALGLAGCAQVTESLNGAGRTIDGVFTPNK